MENCVLCFIRKAPHRRKLVPWEITVASAAPPAPMPHTATNTTSSTRFITAAMLIKTKGCFESPMPRSTAETMLYP